MRLPRADEIAKAAEYVWGESVNHTGSPVGGRAYAAKACYWKALEQAGYSVPEIARMTGADRHTVMHGLDQEIDQCYLTWVIERANYLVDVSL